MHKEWVKNQKGFTIIELLIVIVIIGILAALVIVAYNGLQSRAHDAKVLTDIKSVQKIVEAYAAAGDGTYPSTGGLSVARTDANCPLGSAQSDWVPAVTQSLPQSPQPAKRNAQNQLGCYIYSSDGTSYIISAWNMVDTGPQNGTLYRRLGYREYNYLNSNSYLCNHPNIGGNASGTYTVKNDYYKYSYTASNITSCNETPPAGA